MDNVIAYTHGCWNTDTNEYSYAYVIERDGEVIHKACNKGDNPAYLESKAVVGKCMAVAAAVRWCAANGFSNIVVCYNYDGVEKWAKGEWKTNQPSTEAYKACMEKYMNDVQVSFEHVHKDFPNPFNQLARKLAQDIFNAKTEKAPVTLERANSNKVWRGI